MLPGVHISQGRLQVHALGQKFQVRVFLAQAVQDACGFLAVVLDVFNIQRQGCAEPLHLKGLEDLFLGDPGGIADFGHSGGAAQFLG